MRRDPLNDIETSHDDAMRRGAMALRQADLQGALRRFKAATERFPDRAEPRRMLALAYKADEQYTQSIEQLTAAVALNPSRRPRPPIAR